MPRLNVTDGIVEGLCDLGDDLFPLLLGLLKGRHCLTTERLYALSGVYDSGHVAGPELFARSRDVGAHFFTPRCFRRNTISTTELFSVVDLTSTLPGATLHGMSLR